MICSWLFACIASNVHFFNPKSIGVKYSSIAKAFVMTKAVYNRDICFIQAVLLLCKHGRFFYILRRVV